MIRVQNLYLHADGGYYCILSDAAPMKHPDSGEWLEGVIYMGTDGVMRSTSRARWDDRFSPVAEYDGDDEQVLMMVRRANPGNVDFDFLRTFESWHESEMSITGQMLELAVGAAMERFWAELTKKKFDRPAIVAWTENTISRVELTITAEDLQRVSTEWEIEKVAQPHGFTFILRK